jgi:hypothetical protein
MPYTEQLPHAGSAEVLYTGLFDEPAGTLARTLPRRVIATGTVAAFTTTGQVAACGIPLPAGLIVSNITVMIGNTGVTGPTHYWAGLTDPQSNVLAVSADQGAGAQGGNTALKVAMLVPYQVPQTGLYYIVASSSAATTAPTAAGVVLVGGIAGLAPVLSGIMGSQATPPAVGTQLAAIASNGSTNFLAWIS